MEFRIMTHLTAFRLRPETNEKIIKQNLYDGEVPELGMRPERQAASCSGLPRTLPAGRGCTIIFAYLFQSVVSYLYCVDALLH